MEEVKKRRMVSLEAINPKQSTSLILAMADALVIPLTFIFFVSRAGLLARGIPEGYHEGEDMCPVTNVGREFLYTIDAGVALYTKGYFTTACNIEDGYLRLWIDLFVRGIATTTDSFFLLWATFLRAKLFDSIVVRMIFVPVASVFFGLVTTLVKLGTDVLPDLEGNQNAIELNKWMLAQMDKVQPRAKRLPNTLPRVRPAKDYQDWFKYNYGRTARQFRWFTQQAGNRVEGYVKGAIWYAIYIRLALLVLDQLALLMGMDGLRAVSVAENVFPGAVQSLQQKVSKDRLSSDFLESLFKGLLAFAARLVPRVVGFAANYTPSLVISYVVPLIEFLVNVLMWLVDKGKVYILVAIVFQVGRWSIAKLKDNINGRFSRAYSKAEKDTPFHEFTAQIKWMQ